MLQLKATIRDIDTNDNEIKSISDPIYSENIDGSALLSTLKNDIKPMNSTPFILGASTLGNYSFNKQVDYFIAREQTYNWSKINFTVHTNFACDRITFCFDTNKNVYPTAQINVNGTNFTPDNSIYTVIKDTNWTYVSTTIDYYYTIQMPCGRAQYSTDYPTLISGIFLHPKFEVDAHSIISLDINMKDRSTSNQPSFGITSASGTLSVKDEQKLILKYIQGKLIGRGSPVSVILKDEILNKSENVGKLLVSKINYDDNEHNVVFDLGDGLMNMQEILIDELHISSTTMTAMAIFDYIKSYVSNYTFDIKTSATSILQNTTIADPYLVSTNVWSAFYKLCNLCGLYMYMGTNGEVIVDTQLPYEVQ